MAQKKTKQTEDSSQKGMRRGIEFWILGFELEKWGGKRFGVLGFGLGERYMKKSLLVALVAR